MSDALHDIVKVRKEKLGKLRSRGLDPYPERTPPRIEIADAKTHFGGFSRQKKRIGVAGRVAGLRVHGGVMFADLKDESGKIQLLFRKDIIGEKFSIAELLDLGDFLWASGVLMKTKAGEKTLEVNDFAVLAKALRPIPSEWYGLEDVEERSRKRYLDLLLHDEVKNRLTMRSKITEAIRFFLGREGFLEVETPILQPLYGGARARPFSTHHHFLDVDLYLRIAPELYLKRLLVGGFEKVFELGRVFRNEGTDREHNPEFTMLELYWAYQDRDGLMKFVERMVRHVAKAVKAEVRLGATPWSRVPFSTAVKQAVGVDYEKASFDELKKAGERFGLTFEARASKGEVADEIFKKLYIAKIKTPVFVIDHPVEISPLAKRDVSHPERALRYQLVVDGWEIVNGFAELNDPQDQRERFEAQEKVRKTGDIEAMRYDEDFVEALEYGMPPAAGLGMGIDRVAAWLTGAQSLKEVILFPMMRPKR